MKVDSKNAIMNLVWL